MARIYFRYEYPAGRFPGNAIGFFGIGRIISDAELALEGFEVEVTSLGFTMGLDIDKHNPQKAVLTYLPEEARGIIRIYNQMINGTISKEDEFVRHVAREHRNKAEEVERNMKGCYEILEARAA